MSGVESTLYGHKAEPHLRHAPEKLTEYICDLAVTDTDDTHAPLADANELMPLVAG